jgi:drug/metabolite transporter (DMT)-like permease
MNITKAVILKTSATFLFTVMAVLIRWLGDAVPLGEIVFCRSFFALIPVVVIYAWRGQLKTAVKTKRPFGHIGRGLIGAGGMFFNFGALALLPVADATAISFAGPLATVVLAAVVLRERVRIYRWSAVMVGFIGIIIMLAPHLSIGAGDGPVFTGGLGSLYALMGALCTAGAVVQTRRLTDSETTSSIVFYFSVSCAVFGLITWPLGWTMPAWPQAVALVASGISGGLAQLAMTESYRHAPASFIAPFDYFTMIWAVALGFLVFQEIPEISVLTGAAVVIAAGLFVIWRESQLGIKRRREVERTGPAI